MPTQIIKCKICDGDTTLLLDEQLKIEYHVCSNCHFIYKSTAFHIETEEDEYLRHNNSIEDTGYVNIFLNQIDNFIKDLNIERLVLDFGSGPNPVYKVLLEQHGYQVHDFDPFYNNDLSFKNHQYQLITSNEVPEHFTKPIVEFDLLVSLLEKGGYLLLGTHFRTMNESDFLSWWYRRDVTHISFYSLKTFDYLCQKYGLEIIKHDGKKTILLQKK